jgi:hypothetical protein
VPAASHRLTRALVASAALAAASVPVTAGATGPAASVGASTSTGCRVPLLDRATRGSEVQSASRSDFATAAKVNGVPLRELTAEVSTDRTLWLDTCGRAFHVEPADPAGAARAAAEAPVASTDPGPLSSALRLESNPGAALTIYLDFTGGTVTGTGWNDTYATPSIEVDPFSITSPADTSFTAAELWEVQKAWQVVAEDYASFDVNVTTLPPAPDAIDRSGPADMTYGTRVLITGGGPIYDACGCGGVAYVGSFDDTRDHGYRQPAWVFSRGTATSGKRMGEAASHEAGHNLGLHHDDTASAAYYSGSAPWAPIMGSSYNQPVTQWSAGDYPGATNREDDVAILSSQLGALTDDHADAATGATALGATPLDGAITSRVDADAFTFTAAGSTTLAATPVPGSPDLDIGLRILDSSGALVAVVDPAVVRVGSSTATGLDASWTATLPPEPATYTAVVDGVGTGDPGTSGQYSDYASLGRYRMSLVTETPGGHDLAVVAAAPAPGRVGVAYRAVPATATGGEAPYTWAAAGLPSGMDLDPDTAVVAGTPTEAGSFPVTVDVTDTDGRSATTSFVVTVDPALVTGSVPEPTPVPDVVAPVSITPPVWSADPPPLTSFGLVTRAFLPRGQVHDRYRTTITTRGAVGRVTWGHSGKVPPGLHLVRRASGALVVRGRPTQAGRYVVTLRATDAAGAHDVRRFTLRISR